MELIYTDEAGVDGGVLRHASGDFSVGVENTWSLSVPLPTPLREGCLVYVDGSEFCGVVDDYETVTGSAVATVSGRTIQGVLATNVTCPPQGSDRLAVSGDANECIAAVLENVGLGLPFQAAAKASGVRVDHEFDRFVDAYDGITAMLAASGAKLSVEVSGGRVTLGAEPMRNAIGYDGEASRVRVRRSRAVNHLVCLGSGELQDRAVVHLYADEQGRVGTAQRIFGLGHMAAVYDYSNADEQELRAEGEKKLAEMQSADAAQLEDAIGGAWDVGDVVGVRFGDDGEVVSEVVTEKIARVSGRSVIVECKTGSRNERGTITGSSESSGSGGGVSYVAGDGIVIAGGSISAEVTQAKLDAVAATAAAAGKTAGDAQAAAGKAQQTADGKADKAHSHPWADVTGRPTTYPPEAHGHTWADVTGKPSTYAPSSHTHLYAGSKSPGGAARGAEKLETARKITIAGAVDGSAEFDGSRDVTITVEGDSAAASFLAAHPAGCYFETSDPSDPSATYGGTWTRVPSTGPHKWHREA